MTVYLGTYEFSLKFIEEKVVSQNSAKPHLPHLSQLVKLLQPVQFKERESSTSQVARTYPIIMAVHHFSSTHVTRITFPKYTVHNFT